MKHTQEEAHKKMEKYIKNFNFNWELNYGEHPDIIIHEKLTEEYESYWIFYWQVRNLKDDFSKAIVGNGPMLIEKDTLNMYKLGTGEEVEKQLLQFEEDKDLFLHIEEDEHGNFDAINR